MAKITLNNEFLKQKYEFFSKLTTACAPSNLSGLQSQFDELLKEYQVWQNNSSQIKKSLGNDSDTEGLTQISEKKRESWERKNFSDLIGMENEKKVLKGILIDSLLFPLLSPRIKAILFYGVPGGGKSLLIAHLGGEIELTSAQIKKIKVSIVVGTGSSLQGAYVGESEKLIKSHFNSAQNYALDACGLKTNSKSPLADESLDSSEEVQDTNVKPQKDCKSISILFIDEIDSIGSSRSGQGQSESGKKALLMLIQCMDGINSYDKVVTIGATNRPWDLDSALKSRFAYQIFVDTLDDAAKKKFFLWYYIQRCKDALATANPDFKPTDQDALNLIKQIAPNFAKSYSNVDLEMKKNGMIDWTNTRVSLNLEPLQKYISSSKDASDLTTLFSTIDPFDFLTVLCGWDDQIFTEQDYEDIATDYTGPDQIIKYLAPFKKQLYDKQPTAEIFSRSDSAQKAFKGMNKIGIFKIPPSFGKTREFRSISPTDKIDLDPNFENRCNFLAFKLSLGIRSLPFGVSSRDLDSIMKRLQSKIFNSEDFNRLKESIDYKKVSNLYIPDLSSGKLGTQKWDQIKNETEKIFYLEPLENDSNKSLITINQNILDIMKEQTPSFTALEYVELRFYNVFGEQPKIE